jgi:hypothetical protein
MAKNSGGKNPRLQPKDVLPLRLKAFWSLIRRGQFFHILRLSRLLDSFYRAGFLSAAASSGVLRHLASGPAPLESLAANWK